jgi:hypothetical protein
VTPTLTFTCSICCEPSQMICVYCTKDACGNHLCERCHRCSDCCECELRLDESPEHERAAPLAQTEPVLMDEVIVEETIMAEPVPQEPAVETALSPELESVVNDAPPPPAVAPDLSKLFAPEAPLDQPAPPVFPTSHAAPPEPKSDPDSDPEQ